MAYRAALPASLPATVELLLLVPDPITAQVYKQAAQRSLVVLTAGKREAWHSYAKHRSLNCCVDCWQAGLHSLQLASRSSSERSVRIQQLSNGKNEVERNVPGVQPRQCAELIYAGVTDSASVLPPACPSPRP